MNPSEPSSSENPNPSESQATPQPPSGPAIRSISWLPKPPQPPEVPDYNKIAEASLAKSEAEIKAAEEKVEASRSGRWSQPPQRTSREPSGFTVELDWRGESAYYCEPTRKVWLFISYWGPPGYLEHIDGKWDYIDGRREELGTEERLEVLRQVRDYIRAREGYKLVVKELDGAAL